MSIWLNSFLEELKAKMRPMQDVSAEDLQNWVDSPLGQLILAQQRAQLDDELSQLFGYHLLELSPFPVNDLSRISRINQRTLFSSHHSGYENVVSRFEQLPLPEESMDVVILHHALDFSQQPHQVLREASRVLIPHGHLLIVGFNPFSIQGVWKFILQFFTRDSFWRRNSLAASRLKDWLRLLELEVVSHREGFYRPPFGRSSLLNKFSFLDTWGQRFHVPCAGYYMLIARKDRIGLTPLKPIWSGFKPIRGVSVGKPSVSLGEPISKGQVECSRAFSPLSKRQK